RGRVAQRGARRAIRSPLAGGLRGALPSQAGRAGVPHRSGDGAGWGAARPERELDGRACARAGGRRGAHARVAVRSPSQSTRQAPSTYAQSARVAHDAACHNRRRRVDSPRLAAGAGLRRRTSKRSPCPITYEEYSPMADTLTVTDNRTGKTY